MTIQSGLIGIGAGAAAALLFASVTSGSMLSMLLFYLAPLPILIAGIGWSHWAALIAVLSGALALGAVFGTMFFLAFLAIAGIPAWWLGYLAMLARPAVAADGKPGALEWYPPGRLVVWAALLGALIVLAAVPYFGLDAASFRASLHAALSEMLDVKNGGTLPGVSNVDRFLDFMVLAIPATAAVLTTLTNTVNLWLAAKVVHVSGRLKRPWPTIPAMSFPRLTVAGLIVAIGLSLFGDMIGIVGSVVSASLMLAFGALGFAVLHAITVNNKGRPFMLGVAYASVLVFSWPVLLLCLLGLAETLFDLRERIVRRRGPPMLPT